MWIKIIKDLNHYLNTQISDRIQINFDSEDRYESNPYSELKYNYLKTLGVEQMY